MWLALRLALLSLLLTCCVLQAQSKRITRITIDKIQELAEIESAFEDIGQSFRDFGTKVKNFFTPKSDRPTPRPMDHIPAVIQEQQEPGLLEEAVVKAALDSEVQDQSEDASWFWRLLAKALQ